MAEQSTNARFLGTNQATDRPLNWHVWDITINDANALATDTIMLPERYGPKTVFLMPWVQKIVLSNATTCTMSVRQVKIANAGGAITDLAQPLIGAGLVDMKVLDTAYPGTGTTTWQQQYLDSQIQAGTHLGALRLTVDAKTGGPGTANIRFMLGVLMGRVEY